jgi:hypothetical protein
MQIQRILVRWKRGFRDQLNYTTSDEEFRKRFGDERACRDFLFQARWPRGFECPRCGPARYRWVDEKRLVCLCCHKVRSLTAGTILERTRKPLTLWFRAAFLMVQCGTVSARTLQETLNLTYKVAWSWAHKLRRLMEEKTTIDEAVPPFVADPHTKALEPWVTESQQRRWYVLHGGYEWDADRPGVRGSCCSRLDRADWSFDTGLTKARSRQTLFDACSGAVSDKHLDAYLRQTEFRMNHRGVPRVEVVAELMERFPNVRPCPYRAMRGDRQGREPVRFAMRKRRR